MRCSRPTAIVPAVACPSSNIARPGITQTLTTMRITPLLIAIMLTALATEAGAQGIIRPKTSTTTKPATKPQPRAQAKRRPAAVANPLQKLAADMVYVEGGTFTMGAKADENYWDVEHAWPAHQVTVSGFYLCRYETTQALWQKVMGKNPSEYRGANHPVESVSWNDIQKFIRKLNALTGKHYRLPTEAEWEWGARGGNRSQGYRYSGSNNIDEVAWYKRNTHDRHMPVGTKRPNELGLYDMSGNVFEFCGDGYAPYTSDVQNNPCPAAADGDHPIRGGSFVDDEDNCRCSYRHGQSPIFSHNRYGFRLAMSE